MAGSVLAYWLKRYGFTPTVVEKAPTLRKTGGHASDLFREGISRPVHVEISRLLVASAGVVG